MSVETPRSPSIDHFEWGSFEDVTLWPGGARTC
jgi:hypothetical protein